MLCNETLAIVASGWFWASEACKFILAPWAILLNTVLILALIKCKSVHLHINMRWLLINLSLCSVVASSYLLIKSLYTFATWALGSACKLQVSYTNCKFQESVFIFFKLPILGSIIGLGVERIYALRRINTYQNCKKPILAVVILSVVWLSSLIITSVLVITVGNGWMPYCNALFIYNGRVIKVLASILLPLEVVGVAIYIFNWQRTVLCSKKDFGADTDYALNDRYLKRITMATTRAMFPSSALHAIFWITILGTAAVQVTFIKLTIKQHLILSQHLFYVLSVVHMFLHPLFCFASFDLLRVELVKMFPRTKFFLSIPVNPWWREYYKQECGHQHFEMLTQLWNDEHFRHSSKKNISLSSADHHSIPISSETNV